MGGYSQIENLNVSSALLKSALTLVLVGKTGNGKSATGNSILGRKDFLSKFSFSGVTNTSNLQSTIFNDGHVVNVIDTPGLFDTSSKSSFVSEEIVKCVNLAKDGIHSILLVFSLRNRFSEEEQTVLPTLQEIFGKKIVEYMIVVFTGGDDMDDSKETFNNYLTTTCPEPLQEVICQCNHRVVVFDNKTKDECKKNSQVQSLLSLVNDVIEHNGGQPFTNELFAEFKKFEDDQKEEINKDRLKQLTDMFEEKLKETIQKLEEQLEAARRRVDKAEEDSLRREEECLRREEETRKDWDQKLEDIRKNAQNGKCYIL